MGHISFAIGKDMTWLTKDLIGLLDD